MNVKLIMDNKVKIVKSDCGEYWVDSFNNKWVCSGIGKNGASTKSMSMIGCTDCVDCQKMIDCVGCRNCNRMTDCVACRNCYKCSGLLGMKYRINKHREINCEG